MGTRCWGGELLTTLITTHAPTSIAQEEQNKRTLSKVGKQHKLSSSQGPKTKIPYTARNCVSVPRSPLPLPPLPLGWFLHDGSDAPVQDAQETAVSQGHAAPVLHSGDQRRGPRKDGRPATWAATGAGNQPTESRDLGAPSPINVPSPTLKAKLRARHDLPRPVSHMGTRSAPMGAAPARRAQTPVWGARARTTNPAVRASLPRGEGGSSWSRAQRGEECLPAPTPAQVLQGYRHLLPEVPLPPYVSSGTLQPAPGSWQGEVGHWTPPQLGLMCRP